jgi:hypothetical protein
LLRRNDELAYVAPNRDLEQKKKSNVGALETFVLSLYLPLPYL